MLLFQTSPVGGELFSFVNAFFCSNKFAWILVTLVKTLNRTDKWHEMVMLFGKHCCFYYNQRHDVKAFILMFQNNETAAILLFQTSPVGGELFSFVNAFFCSNKFAWILVTLVKTLNRTDKWHEMVMLFGKHCCFYYNQRLYSV